MEKIIEVVFLLLDVVTFVVIAHVIMSWLIGFQVINPRNNVIGQIWESLNRLLTPLYSKVRRFLPDTGGVDFAPLVVLIGISVVRILLG